MPASAVLYAPPPPRTRQSSRKRVGGVVRVCCYLMALVGVAATCALLYFALKGAQGAKRAMDFPHADLIDGNATSTNVRVWPLLNATTPFRVRATVWLDVTQHLQQGGTLPNRPDGTPIAVVTYTSDDAGGTRSEAVLYSDVVAKMDDWQAAAQYKDVPLRIPVEPLYTQDLGPSTLRLTTQVELADDALDGTFVFASSLYKPSAALLPRSPASLRITYGVNDTDDTSAQFSNAFHSYLRAKTVNQALEHAASSTSLLSLMRSRTYVDNSSLCSSLGGNVHAQSTVRMPTFLDGAAVHRRFAVETLRDKHGRRLYLHGKQCELLVPHVRAKASVFVVSSLDKPLQLTGYAARQNALRASSVRSCLSFATSMTTMTSLLQEKCGKVRANGALETCLVFSTHPGGTDEHVTATDQETLKQSFAFRYAPMLWMRTGAAAEHHHYTIPRVQPSSNTKHQTTTAVERRKPDCALPVLTSDSTAQFFDVTLQLRIASAKGMRLQLTDSFTSDVTQEDDKKVAQLDDDDDDDVRVHGTHATDLLWEAANVLAGDRSHPDSKPLVRFFASCMQFVIACALALLPIGYWYTRTTTAGLCMWAQWAGAASLATEAVLTVVRWCTAAKGEQDTIGALFVLAATLFSTSLIVKVLLRINVVGGATWRSMRVTQRPLDKAERQCRMAESRLTCGGYGAVAFIAIMLLHDLLTRPAHRVLRDGYGCYEQQDDYVRQARRADVLLNALERTASLGQMLFNVVSPALQNRRRRTGDQKAGALAGNFKIFFYLFLLDNIVKLAVGHVRRIGGHLHRRAPLSLSDVEMLLVSCVGAYQAWTLPGVPQLRDDEEEEEEEGRR